MLRNRHRYYPQIHLKSEQHDLADKIAHITTPFLHRNSRNELAEMHLLAFAETNCHSQKITQDYEFCTRKPRTRTKFFFSSFCVLIADIFFGYVIIRFKFLKLSVCEKSKKFLQTFTTHLIIMPT